MSADGPKFSFLLAVGVIGLMWYWLDSSGQLDADPAPPPPLPESAAAVLRNIPVGKEASTEDYERDDWPHWSTGEGGCNTREATLVRDGWKVTTAEDCSITGGTWRSRYDRVRHTSPDTLQIDHRVPLAEAYASGGHRWTRAKRERFANDPLNVIAVTGSLNQSKGDQDPAEWLPTYDQCAYVAVWVVLKDQYHLSMDRAERRAVVRVLSRPSCSKGQH
jgi:hypothetical protein